MQSDGDGPPPTALPRRKPSNGSRKPLFQEYPKAKPSFGPRFLEDRPECAVIVARCVSLWSYIETELALLLASILKINTEQALAVFLAIQNSRTQQSVLRAAAEVGLSEPNYELLGAILNITASIEKERNDLVHGLFGGSMLVKDGILWMEQKHNTAHTAKVWASDYTDTDQSRIRNRTFVYEAEDLETIAQRLEWLHQMIGFFRGYSSSDNEPWRAERYHQLCADPRIAQELSRVREIFKKIKHLR